MRIRSYVVETPVNEQVRLRSESTFAVGRRKAFPNAFSNDLGVIEQTPADPKAVNELLSVVGALYTQKVDDGYSRAPRRKVG